MFTRENPVAGYGRRALVGLAWSLLLGSSDWLTRIESFSLEDLHPENPADQSQERPQ
jgi:hypothetical protein